MRSDLRLLAVTVLFAGGCTRAPISAFREGDRAQLSFALLGPEQVALSGSFTFDLAISFSGKTIRDRVEVVDAVALAPIEVPARVLLTVAVSTEIAGEVFEAAFDVPPLQPGRRFSTSVSLNRRGGAADAGPSEDTGGAVDAGVEADASVAADASAMDVTPPSTPRLISEEESTFMGQLLTAPQMSSSVPMAVPLSNTAYAIVWQDRSPVLGGGGDDDIYLRVYDGDLALGPAVAISTHPADGRSRGPAVAAGPAGELVVVWSEDGDIDRDRVVDADIILRIRGANGVLMPDFIIVSDDGGAMSPGDASQPSVAIDASDCAGSA